jgi:hypothetical protein
MDLDRLFQRVFGDAEPEHWGTGWISGTLSVFLGVLGLAAVACLIWPQLLTSPDVRALLPLTWVRASIGRFACCTANSRSTWISAPCVSSSVRRALRSMRA